MQNQASRVATCSGKLARDENGIIIARNLNQSRAAASLARKLWIDQIDVN